MKEPIKDQFEVLGDAHVGTSVDTPLRPDAFEKTDEEKITTIQHHFTQIMETLGLDLTDDSLSGTPYRVAKMHVKELFHGLNPEARPKTSTFENKYGYSKMWVEQNINLNSSCEHHFLPITGKAQVAYIPKDQVIGLSKINRLVSYYAHRPQVQECLSLQIMQDLQETLQTQDVMVVIQAKHLCVSSRGIKDQDSFTTSMAYGGVFEETQVRQELTQIIGKIDDH